jgi:hypothetical protein
MNVKSSSTKNVDAANNELNERSKKAIVYLRTTGNVSAKLVAAAFGISTGSVAAYSANANRSKTVIAPGN